MTFVPMIPSGGNAGLAYLNRTREAQQSAFDTSGRIPHDVEYFKENIGKVDTVDDLMSDHRLLTVALGAFGLDEDINSKFFIRKALSEGSLSPDAFANKLSDKRYLALTKAFGFDLSTPRSKVSDFADKITAQYTERQFEIAVGEQNVDLRMALSFERELASALKQSDKENAQWFTIMASPPLRKVFDGAFNLPTAFGTLDVDRQLDIYKDKAEAYFGTSSPEDFLKPEKQDELMRRFLVQSELQAGMSMNSTGSIALTLLQSVPSPYGSLF